MKIKFFHAPLASEPEREKERRFLKQEKQISAALLALLISALGPFLILLAYLVGLFNPRDFSVVLFFLGLQSGIFLSPIAVILCLYSFRFLVSKISIGLVVAWWIWFIWLCSQPFDL